MEDSLLAGAKHLTPPTRRTLRPAGTLALFLALLIGACAPSVEDTEPKPEGRSEIREGAAPDPAESTKAAEAGADGLSPVPGTPEHGLLAVSLRRLQVELRDCGGSNRCREEVLYLGGLTEVLGYVEDLEARDLVLVGQEEDGLPPIRSEDFAVTLRNAWLEYAPVRGRTVTYSYPGCDIRPTAETLDRLNAVGARLDAAGMEGVEPVVEAWREVCREAQTISVFGVPDRSHFSAVMVTADYHLKDITNGGTELDLPGLRSLTELQFAAAKKAVVEGRPLARGSLNRFWLLPGDGTYEEAPGIVTVDVPVRVDTHRIGQDRSGELVDVQGRDPLAEEFARDLSLLYDHLAGVAPEYRELANLFQLLAVAKVMHLRGPHESVGLDLDYLLHGLPIEAVEVPSALPGRSSVERFVHQEEAPGGHFEARLWMPSCGGVEMRVEPELEELVADAPGLEALRQTVLAARPTPETLSWPVGVQPQTSAASPLLRRKLAKLSPPGKPLVVRVRKDGLDYSLHTKDHSPLFQGPDVRELLRAVRQAASAAGVDTSYMVLENFSDKDAATFRDTYQVQAPNVAPDLSVRSVNSIADTELERILLEQGVRLVEVSSIQRDPDTGWMKALVKLSVTLGGVVRNLTVVVLARTAELVDGFLQKLHLEFSVFDNLPFGALELIDRLERDYRREQGVDENDFRILLEEQGLGIHWAWLPRQPEARAA